MLTFLTPAVTAMQVVPCRAPIGPLEPAPLTCLDLGLPLRGATVSAFWNVEEAYYVRIDGCDQADPDVLGWYRIEAGYVTGSQPDGELERWASAALELLDVIPIGAGRVAFPIGSTGRTVYRVWRTKGQRADGARSARRTRILGARAGRSLRQPA